MRRQICQNIRFQRSPWPEVLSQLQHCALGKTSRRTELRQLLDYIDTAVRVTPLVAHTMTPPGHSHRPATALPVSRRFDECGLLMMSLETRGTSEYSRTLLSGPSAACRDGSVDGVPVRHLLELHDQVDN